MAMTNNTADIDTTSRSRYPVVLCILDGWGERVETTNNAVALAKTPTWDRLIGQWPKTSLDACGCEVGLPDGQMGNSEVGHMNIGAGRIVMQDLPRINTSMREQTLGTQPVLLEAIEKLRRSGGVMHIMGLMSPGGVHSHQKHIVAIAEIFANAGIPVRIHAFLDGRDTPPSSAKGYVDDFLEAISGYRDVKIVTAMGRYFGMDRDKRWERVTKAARAIQSADGRESDNVIDAIEGSYQAGITDEFIEPIILEGFKGIQDGDGLMMANFRADRAREILSVLADPDFSDCLRSTPPNYACVLGLTEYSTDHNRFVDTVFPPETLTEVLGEVVSDAGLKQLRIAETEKYAHVTFFLNGGREQIFDGEERVLVPSPKVATYDLQPEMSAPEVTDKLIEGIEGGNFGLIVVNFANGDMVGHTGQLEAAMKAAETVDTALARLETVIIKAGGMMLVTADHGNLECMVDANTGENHTAHTLNTVPLILINGPEEVEALKPGRLSDLAPTLLDLLGIDQPKAMTGQSLLKTGGIATRAAE